MNVLSINMAINNGDPERRYAELSGLSVGYSPDVMLIQEVSIDHGQQALRSLAGQLGHDYKMFYEPVYPGQEDEQGVAIITNRPVWGSSRVDFGLGGNQIQVARLGSKNGTMTVANVHLEASPACDLQRSKKLILLDEYLDFKTVKVPLIVAGDFNAPPFFPSILAMKHFLGYDSAQQLVHGHEPSFTYPVIESNELIDGRYVGPDELKKLKRLGRVTRGLVTSADGIAQFTLDYIFIKNMPRPVAARTFSGAATISDHAGQGAVFSSSV